MSGRRVELKLEWDETYSVGNDVIDEQHRKWIELYNRLDEMMRGPDQADLAAARDEILQEMSDYVDYHFKFEEDYMRSIGFPEVDKHWRMHKDFANSIYSLCRDREEGKIILNTEIIETIRNWLVHHIIKEDIKITNFLDSGKVAKA